MSLGVDGFHALPEECQAEGLAWVSSVVAAHADWTQEVVAKPDGSWDIYVIEADENDEPKLNDEGNDVVLRVVNTRTAPPLCIQRAI